MGSDPEAKKVRNGGCPECSGALVETNRDRVPGGIDWHTMECVDCEYRRTI